MFKLWYVNLISKIIQEKDYNSKRECLMWYVALEQVKNRK